MVLGKQFRWRRYSTFVALHRFCRKARKSVFAMCIWRLSSIFDLGLCVFDRPIRIQHFTPCARAVDKQALGTRLNMPDQVKVSQLSPTARNLYNKLRRIDGRIIRSKNRLLIFRNHLKSGTLPKGYSPKINPSIGSNRRIFTDKWQSNIDNYGKMQLKLIINETELLVKSLTEQSGSLKLNLKAICSFEVFHSLINKINITNEKLEQQLVKITKPKHKIINVLLTQLLLKYMI